MSKQKEVKIIVCFNKAGVIFALSMSFNPIVWEFKPLSDLCGAGTPPFMLETEYDSLAEIDMTEIFTNTGATIHDVVMPNDILFTTLAGFDTTDNTNWKIIL